MRNRTRGSPYVQFVTGESMNFVFGTIIVMLSLVRITVLRARICCTWPVMPATSTRSPSVIGLSARMTKPLMKLLAIFCNPKPTPTPTAPAKTVSAPRWIPVFSRTMKMPTTSTTLLTIWEIAY